jgi:endonuclease YncB( thermonuclease family)
VTAPRAAAFPRTYPCVVVDVHDGDTARVFLDRGGDDWWLTSVRLFGCAARELRDPGGTEARDYLRGILARITPPTVPDMFLPRWQGQCESLKWDKFGGRVDGRLWLPDTPPDVSTMMIRGGMAAAWDGKGTQPKPAWPVALP